jgi:serine/threonine protein kinase
MTICGTPGFVAPEIMLGTDYDASCDSFSFGNVIAELITLQRPGKDFWNRNAEDGYKLNLDELRKIAPKDCPKVFLELCLQCCNYDPTQRPGTLINTAIHTHSMNHLLSTLPLTSS